MNNLDTQSIPDPFIPLQRRILPRGYGQPAPKIKDKTASVTRRIRPKRRNNLSGLGESD